MSVGEYAEACGAQERADDGRQSATWAEFIDSLKSLANELGDMNPPAELQAFHDARVSGLDELMEVVRAQPAQDEFSPHGLLEPDLIAAGAAIESAASALPEPTLDELTEAECVTDSDRRPRQRA